MCADNGFVRREGMREGHTTVLIPYYQLRVTSHEATSFRSTGRLNSTLFGIKFKFKCTSQAFSFPHRAGGLPAASCAALRARRGALTLGGALDEECNWTLRLCSRQAMVNAAAQYRASAPR